MKIGVCGSTSVEEPIGEELLKLGQALGKGSHQILIGCNANVPYEVACHAHRNGSEVTGYSTSTESERERLSRSFVHQVKQLFRAGDGSDPAHIMKEIVDLPTGMERYKGQARVKMRNVAMVGDMEAAVFIAGGWGTTTEYATARSRRIPLGLFKGTGGAADLLLDYTRELDGPSTLFDPIYTDDAQELIDLLVERRKQYTEWARNRKDVED